MKLEDQCISLELAKRLKELGAKQESLFYWIHRRLSIHLSIYLVYPYFISLITFKPNLIISVIS